MVKNVLAGIRLALLGVAGVGFAYFMKLPNPVLWSSIGLTVLLFALGYFLSARAKRVLEAAAQQHAAEGYSVQAYLRHMAVFKAAIERQHPIYQAQLVPYSQFIATLAGYEKSEGLFALLKKYAEEGDTSAAQEVMNTLEGAIAVGRRQRG